MLISFGGYRCDLAGEIVTDGDDLIVNKGVIAGKDLTNVGQFTLKIIWPKLHEFVGITR